MQAVDEDSDRVRLRAPARAPAGDEAEQAEAFARQYYRWVAPDDLADRSPLDVYGAALAHFDLARRRAPGALNVRVYNPQFDVDGWQSTHTAVEVVADDMPFLTDSVTAELNRGGYRVHLIIHPVISVRRDEEGRLGEVLSPSRRRAQDAITEAVIHAEVDRQTDPAELAAIQQHVRAGDRRGRRRRRGLAEDARQGDGHRRAPRRSRAGRDRPRDIVEAGAFLCWLEDHNFTFLGYRDYDIVQEDGEVRLNAVPGTGLGILRQSEVRKTSSSPGFDRLPPAVRAKALEPYLLNLTKANSRATVHRPAFLDYVGVKRFDDEGNVIGERRFLGLYTHTAYRANPRDIPILRRKADAVLARATFPPGSHNEKALIQILESHPRDELIQASVDELFDIAMGILHLGERQRVRLFVRPDAFGRFLSCLIFVPRDRFNTGNRRRIERILREAYDAQSIDYTTRVSESVLVRLHYMLYGEPGQMRQPDTAEVERRILEATRSWVDDLAQALVEEHGEERGNALYRRWGDAFPTAYRADWVARSAVTDITRIESLGEDDLALVVYRPLEAAPGALRAKVFRTGAPLTLSDMLPMFENMGVQVGDERPYELKPRDGAATWIYDFGLTYEGELQADQIRESFQDAFIRAWRDEVENDGYNRLVLRARTDRAGDHGAARGRALPAPGRHHLQRSLRRDGARRPSRRRGNADRALPRPLRPRAGRRARGRERDRARRAGDRRRREPRPGPHPAQLPRRHPGDAAHQLLPARRERLQALPVVQARPLATALAAAAASAVRDLRLRAARRGRAPARRPGGSWRAALVGPPGGLPHGGPRADEGADGQERRDRAGGRQGRVRRQAPAALTRGPARGGAGLLSTFIRGLLDVTDNIRDGEVVPPPRVVRYDEDDPYLVVAADRGTATFSDVANEISGEYGFWLGDAFASGGSSGYDHKAMGITARGAWESVKRHFRELGHDVQTQDFTVVGVGDMSGDVFGNGMLLSPHIRLVGAFDHRDIFIDPDPDPARSFEERKRLFELSSSSWADYDMSLVSKGGGVFPRSAKSIPLSKEIRELLDVEEEAMTPHELIRALLRAPVDLFWNGGIGTYVKASSETHTDAGDKANDHVRVDARELRCRVVGEGGNLGLTQCARIEYAHGGGRVNTDAIDNSGGVDCSDHEVNIKILLDVAVAEGDLTGKQRDALLVEMTDAVAASVLKNDYEQAETLTLAETQAPDMLDVHARFIRYLESSRNLDRELEALPADDELTERKQEHRGLVRPELAVLLAYAKIDLYRALLDSDVPEDSYLSAELQDYFPAPLPERFGERMEDHRLRREIVATQVVNNLLHGGGTTFAFRMHEESGAPASDIARAYTVAREVFGMRPQWEEIEALDNSISAETAGGDAARGPQAGGARVALAAAQPPVPDEHRRDRGALRARRGGALRLRGAPARRRRRAGDPARRRARGGGRAGGAGRARGRPGLDGLGAGHRRRRRRDGPRRRGRRGGPLPPGERARAALAARPDPRPAARRPLERAGARRAARRPVRAPPGAHRRGAARQPAGRRRREPRDRLGGRQPGGRALPADARPTSGSAACST